ncbi:hypothetical protein AAFF_G00356890 [Aldrovandia affinis]|uniref:Uncharacterized protein n=1 Tax=Aldrovandia affinis TaxID=143900 RepID=A0AAD7T8L9_9TELE|nr:hypothetical protein AAFF_G00356890 [Aldrovandia affinis]
MKKAYDLVNVARVTDQREAVQSLRIKVSGPISSPHTHVGRTERVLAGPTEHRTVYSKTTGKRAELCDGTSEQLPAALARALTPPMMVDFFKTSDITPAKCPSSAFHHGRLLVFRPTLREPIGPRSVSRCVFTPAEPALFPGHGVPLATPPSAPAAALASARTRLGPVPLTSDPALFVEPAGGF